MSGPTQIPHDLAGRFRQQATPAGLYVFTVAHNLPIRPVALVPTPISLATIPCTQVIIQADNGNGNFIYLGGPDMTVVSGLELTAGQAAAVYPAEIPGDWVIRSTMGIGIERYVGGRSGPASQDQKVRVVSLSHIFLVAAAAGLNARVMYYPVTV